MKKEKQAVGVNTPEFMPQRWRRYLKAGCYPYALEMYTNEAFLIGDLIGKRCTSEVKDKQLIKTLVEELENLGYEVEVFDEDPNLNNTEGILQIYLLREVHTGYYHFLRKDNNNMWSHKFPDELPTDRDSYGAKIQTPDSMLEAPFYGWYLVLS